MHYILEKLLGRRGIKDTTELDDSEKQTYDKWQKILSEGVMTVDKIQEFCRQQLSIIEGKFKDPENTPEKAHRLTIIHTVYKSIIDCIEKPKMEKENLEKYLQSLIE